MNDIEAAVARHYGDAGLLARILAGLDGISAIGYNRRLILKWLRKLSRKIIAAIRTAIIPFSTLKAAY